jgi:chemotaxis protein CheX
MNADQLHHFKTITLDYFGKLTAHDDTPALEEAFMQFDGPILLDYTSMVTISGECDGCIYMTSSSQMLEQILAAHGEPEMSDRTRMDMCREFSNVLAGNASSAFGANWQISVPRSMNKEEFSGVDLPPSTFIMPIA